MEKSEKKPDLEDTKGAIIQAQQDKKSEAPEGRTSNKGKSGGYSVNVPTTSFNVKGN